ncbi:POU domain, class 6, transcription factor 2 isoform X2 [Hippocampus zosterae]|uniref:POU domain, class 6, transcription factor 2 isoform X2 n=1 Tax=Hippocampus zosterae TaxID=109293 RepID=UPI00223E1E17|nr:POU domain, class 6, transcription factor 2 isoform X2 [Hippocampus zosterae]
MLTGGQLSKPLLSLMRGGSDMSALELGGRPDDKAAGSPDSELNDETTVLPADGLERDGAPAKLYGARESSLQSDINSSPTEQSQVGQSHPGYAAMGPQSLLVAQQLANAVGGAMSGAAAAMNQPILIPFSAGGHLSGQQGLVLSLPATNLQSLVAAAAAGGIMTLPLHNLQATSTLNSQLQHLQQLQQMHQHHQQQQHHHQHTQNQVSSQHHHMTSPGQQQTSVPSPGSACSSASGQPPQSPPSHRPNQSPARSLPSPVTPPVPLPPLNPLASQAAVAAAAAAAAMAAGSQVFGNTLSNLQGGGGQLVTNAQGQIIGTIPLMANSAAPSSQSGGGNAGLQVPPITPQLLTNAQGQIIATVIGNQILPVINTQGITLSPIKQGASGPASSSSSSSSSSLSSSSSSSSQPGLLHMAHRHSPLHLASSSSSSTNSSSSALSVGQLVSNPGTAPSEVDGVNLEEIREFAKAFKIRRLSLGLTQTQVGQALSAAEGPAYSQSAICRHTILRSHFFLPQEAQESTIASSLTGKLNPGLLYPARFEKLDITPKSAQKIKPVLERWMAEAEARHRSGMQNLSDFIGSEPSKKRKRRTSFTPQALEILNSHFEKNTHPSGQEMTEIAEKLNYDREVVRVWFCNKRQALKNTIKRLKQPEGSGGGAALPPPTLDLGDPHHDAHK